MSELTVCLKPAQEPPVPRTLTELEAILANRIARSPERLGEILEETRSIIDTMLAAGFLKNERFGRNPSKLTKRVRLAAGSTGLRSMVTKTLLVELVEKGLSRPSSFDDRRNDDGSWAWPTRDEDWSGGKWHRFENTMRRTQEPVTSFAGRILDAFYAVTAETEANPLYRPSFEIARADAKAFMHLLGREFKPDAIGRDYQSNVLAASLTTCTVRYLEYRGSIAKGGLDHEGHALTRLLMPLATLSADLSGRFHGTYGLSAFVRNGKSYQVDCYPAPSDESPLTWRADEVFIHTVQRDSRPPRLFIPESILPERGDDYCPAIRVRVTGQRNDDKFEALGLPSLYSTNPVAAIAAVATAYETGNPLSLTGAPFRDRVTAGQCPHAATATKSEALLVPAF